MCALFNLYINTRDRRRTRTAHVPDVESRRLHDHVQLMSKLACNGGSALTAAEIIDSGGSFNIELVTALAVRGVSVGNTAVCSGGGGSAAAILVRIYARISVEDQRSTGD
jgi:hypothetical protein